MLHFVSESTIFGGFCRDSVYFIFCAVVDLFCLFSVLMEITLSILQCDLFPTVSFVWHSVICKMVFLREEDFLTVWFKRCYLCSWFWFFVCLKNFFVFVVVESFLSVRGNSCPTISSQLICQPELYYNDPSRFFDAKLIDSRLFFAILAHLVPQRFRAGCMNIT